MKIEPVEIYSDATNLAVMRHPGRKFPGSLIQGDSLFILTEEARELCKAVSASADAELIALAKTLREALEERLMVYEEALVSHAIELPYFKRANE